MSRERNTIFSSNLQIHQLHIRGYLMTKNSFLVEVTFNSFDLQSLIKIPTCYKSLLSPTCNDFIWTNKKTYHLQKWDVNTNLIKTMIPINLIIKIHSFKILNTIKHLLTIIIIQSFFYQYLQIVFTIFLYKTSN